MDKWNTRTQLASGAAVYKKFKTLNKTINMQIDDLFADLGELKARTQVKRGGKRTLGKPAAVAQPEERDALVVDDEIFDDTDFYQQLLRELVTGGVDLKEGVSKEFLDLQRRKKQKTVSKDRKASKGRKIRYIVHDKLINFVPPKEEHFKTEWDVDDLYSKMFGSKG